MAPTCYGEPQPSPPNHINQLHDHNQHHGSSILNAGSSNFHQSMSISPFAITKESSSICGHNSASQKQYEEEDHKSEKLSPEWMPASKPGLMQKTVTGNSTCADKPTQISPRLQNLQRGCRYVNASTSSANTGRNPIRVCADCNTTTTPLWRSGPRGPKSLCNACGIRRRKQSKVIMAEVSVAAANDLPVPEASSTKNNRRHTKEKKRLVNHLTQFKNKSRSAAGAATCTSQVMERKLSFKDFTFWTHNSFRQAFPRDEVADAAFLLMELSSCGFDHL